jgi:pyrroloquinoline quinone (PQQ) biosynthesis protein C
MANALEKHYGVPKPALDFYYVHAHVEEDHRDRAVRILTDLCVTETAQKTGLSAMRRAITARRICIDGLMEAFVSPSPSGRGREARARQGEASKKR